MDGEEQRGLGGAEAERGGEAEILGQRVPAAGGGRLGRHPRQLVLAVTFLTALPLRPRAGAAPADLWGSMGWYPLVGLGLGAAAWGAYAGFAALAPPPVAAALVVLLLELATRGLHMDGLMDTCDGYFSGAPGERALEIMKDSRAGAMGVIGAVLVIVLKVAALSSLPGEAAATALLAGWAAARFTAPLAVLLWPYAREAGTGKPFSRRRSPDVLALAAAWLLVALLVAGVASVVTDAGAWWHGVVIVAVALAVVLPAQAAVAKRLGGLTGDVYGMGVQLAETTALVAAAILIS